MIYKLWHSLWGVNDFWRIHVTRLWFLMSPESIICDVTFQHSYSAAPHVKCVQDFRTDHLSEWACCREKSDVPLFAIWLPPRHCQKQQALLEQKTFTIEVRALYLVHLQMPNAKKANFSSMPSPHQAGWKGQQWCSLLTVFKACSYHFNRPLILIPWRRKKL